MIFKLVYRFFYYLWIHFILWLKNVPPRIRRKIITFPSDDLEDEEIKFVIRKHKIFLIRPFGRVVFFGVFFPAIFLFFIVLFSELEINDLFSDLFLILSVSWISSWIGYFIYHFLVWYQDCMVLTDKSIRDIDQISILNKKVTSVSWDKINEVSYSQEGFWNNVLQTGDITVSSSGEYPQIEIMMTHEPNKVVDNINKLADNYKRLLEIERIRALTDQRAENARKQAELQIEVEKEISKIKESKNKHKPEYLK